MDSISKAIETVKKETPSIEYRLDEPMKNHTSFKIGSPVRLMLFPKSVQELTTLCGLLQRFEIRPLIIGNGSNLLVDDSGTLEIIALKTTGIDSIALTGETEITAGAGASLAKLAVFACEKSLSGLEFAYGIPGTLGGAISMNAGAYGLEMKDIVQNTYAHSYSAGGYKVAGEQHGFAYRRSRFTESGDIVLSSAMKLQKGDKGCIEAKMDEYAARRRESQPLELPSAGSTFKRPKGAYAAELIERAGLKGFSIGAAQVSDKHSGFIVNTGGATFTDVIAVIRHVRMTVITRFGVELEPEIKIISRQAVEIV